MSHLPANPQAAQTVPVRVQVIDTQPFALDLTVPTYLTAGDLTQRVAEDSGLGRYWPDGTRRLYWLRARGRVLDDGERLDELGIVPHELLHLLPQPPQGSGVEERPPEYPEVRGYAAAGNLNVAMGLGTVGLWTTGWGIALLATQNLFVTGVPSLGLALLCVSFARHLLGGEGSSMRIPILAFLVYLPLLGMVSISTFFFVGLDGTQVALMLAPAFVMGVFGVLLGWLAWYGAVEPLPKVTTAQATQQEAQAVYQCGICGLEVTPDVRTGCQFQCGQIFHSGCYAARASVSQGGGCAVCGYQPAG